MNRRNLTRTNASLMNLIGSIFFGRETVRVKQETRKGLRVRFEKNYYRAISVRFPEYRTVCSPKTEGRNQEKVAK